VFLTPSGRFETGTKVCLSFSAYHPELWQPAWGIRLILEALISFLPTPADGAIGSLDWTKEERQRLAKKSIDFCCPRCGNVAELLPKIEGKSKAPSRFQKEIEQLHALQITNEAMNDKGTANNSETEGNETDSEESAADKEEETEAVSNMTDVEDGATPRLDEEGKVTSAVSAEKSAKEHATEDVSNDSGSDAVVLEESDSGQLGHRGTVVESEQTENIADRVVGERTPGNGPDSIPPWFADSVVHAGIIIFAILVYVLYYKILALLEDLRSLS